MGRKNSSTPIVGTGYQIHHGDALRVLKESFPSDYFDSLVTDPPYGIKIMSQTWDAKVPKRRFWREALRVLKPGAYGLAFFSTRTYHKGVTEIEAAGFQIRDSLCWIYFAGYPHSKDMGQGRGTALKPAWEPIVLFRKPIRGEKLRQHLEDWGTGALNIDLCRIGEVNGRFPANVAHDGSQQVIDTFPDSSGAVADVPEGVEREKRGMYSKMKPTFKREKRGDTGSAARFFFCGKASPTDRDNGLGGKRNAYATVKPTELMRWLCKLVTPRGGKILDPFFGTGSTGRGALLEGYKIYGADKNPDACALAELRCKAIIDGKYEQPEPPTYERTNDQIQLL